MEWLSQNWIWIVLAAAALWFFTRRGHGAMGGCGMAHEGPQKEGKPQGTNPQGKDEAVSGQGRRGGCC